MERLSWPVAVMRCGPSLESVQVCDAVCITYARATGKGPAHAKARRREERRRGNGLPVVADSSCLIHLEGEHLNFAGGGLDDLVLTSFKER